MGPTGPIGVFAAAPRRARKMGGVPYARGGERTFIILPCLYIDKGKRHWAVLFENCGGNAVYIQAD